MPNKIILFGNGSFYSVAVFRSLLDRGLTPVAVGLPEYPPATLNATPELVIESAATTGVFYRLARELSIPVIYAPAATRMDLAEKLAKFKASYLLVACWPYLIPVETVAAVNKLAFNLHPSLLPKYSGANPVKEQLAHGETRLGVTLHKLSQVFDSGEIVGQRKFKLGATSLEQGPLESMAARTGVELVLDAIQGG